MLNQDLVPTPLLMKSEKRAIEYVDPVKPGMRGLSITVNILRWALDMMLLWFTFNWHSKSKGVVTRRMIERLGFLWVKLGQILSLRKDFFGDDFCDELSSLQSSATFFSFDIVEHQICTGLGKPLDGIFSAFDKVPLAAASIAQVHRARLKREQKDVVVKIMRPHAKEIFFKDLRFLRRCVRVLNWLGVWSNMRWDEAIWEIQHMMMEESDYHFELSNLKRYKKCLKKHKIYVPKVFPDYCTQHVLVMEYVPGVLLSDFNDVHKVDPCRVVGWCEDNNFDAEKAGLHLLLSFSRQVFEDNLFHADLHPGNIMLLKNSKIVLIDIGSVGTVEADLQRRFFTTLKSLALKDYYKVADLMISFCPKVPMMDLSELTEELVRCLRDWEIKTTIRNMDYYEKSVTLVILEMVELMSIKYRLSIGWAFLKITRSWCNLESSLNCMMPEANNLKAFAIYFAQRDARAIRFMSNPKTIRSLIVSIPDTFNEYRLFIEPRIRRASRVVQLGLKRGDHVIMGLSRLLSSSFALLFYTLLTLFLVLFARDVAWVDMFLYFLFPEQVVHYFQNVGNQFVSIIEGFFGVSLQAENRWWWVVPPVIVAFNLWRRIKKFRGDVGDSDVQLEGFVNR